MKTASIVYYSGTGHTGLLAEAVARGVGETGGVTAKLRPIHGERINGGRFADDELFAGLAQSDAIIFGTPTYMGGVAAQFKAFADASAGIWFAQGWRNKVAGGFTGSSSPSGDKLSTLQYLALLASQHSMLWVGLGLLPSAYQGKADGMNRLGSFLGLMARNETPQGQASTLDPGDELTARTYGRRIAEVLQAG